MRERGRKGGREGKRGGTTLQQRCLGLINHYSRSDTMTVPMLSWSIVMFKDPEYETDLCMQYSRNVHVHYCTCVTRLGSSNSSFATIVPGSSTAPAFFT